METKKIRILLGSGSPRRKQLISALGFEYRVKQSHTDEIPQAGLIRGDMATSLAEEKALALENERLPGEILLTADTIVCYGDIVLNKPGDETHAMAMLSILNGQTHQVYTGVCIFSDSGKNSFSVRSDVTFEKLRQQDLLEYIRNYMPFDKAGSYGAQECLPPEMNPCSAEEINFLKRNNLSELFNETLVRDHHNVIPLIKKIDGSYFNVMGLPIIEVWKAVNG